MSLVLASLHSSSLELRFLVPPCPGRLGSVLRGMKELFGCARVRHARLCVLSRALVRGAPLSGWELGEESFARPLRPLV